MAVVVAVATWLVAAPVLAATQVGGQSGPGEPAVPSRSAPQCDQRGATTFAPTPTLDPPNASIDLGDPADDLRVLAWTAYEQGRAPMPESGAAISDAVLARVERVKKAPFVREGMRLGVEETEHRGVKSLIERPPRG